MKKTEKKVGFWTYFMALNFGADSVSGAQNGRPLWTLVVSVLLLLWGIIFVGGAAIPITLVFALCGVTAIIMLCNIVRVRPSLFHLLPIGRTRRTVFFFLSILLTMLFSAVLLGAAFTIVLLFVALIMLVTSGEWIFVIEDAGSVIETPCLEGELLALVLTVGILGTVMIVASIESKGLRQTLTLLLPVFALTPLLFFVDVGSIPFGKLFILFNKISCCYSILILSGVVAVVLAAVGIIRIVKFLKPKGY